MGYKGYCCQTFEENRKLFRMDNECRFYIPGNESPTVIQCCPWCGKRYGYDEREIRFNNDEGKKPIVDLPFKVNEYVKYLGSPFIHQSTHHVSIPVGAIGRVESIMDGGLIISVQGGKAFIPDLDCLCIFADSHGKKVAVTKGEKIE
jgi:hypothetical protein